MSGPVIDEVDRIILHALQENARYSTNAKISEGVSVSASTVSKRISKLEDCGVIKGYHTEIDYERAGFPLRVLFICTASITEREALVEDTLGIDGVLNVRELMTGDENVHIQAVGSSTDDITRIAYRLDELGYAVNDEVLMRDEYDRPSVQFDVAPDRG